MEEVVAAASGKTKRQIQELVATRPRRTAPSLKPGRISRAARREVFARDGEQCTFVGAEGERCPARGLLEVDHVKSRALRGSDDAGNLRVRCRAHNQLHAEEVFGREHVARQRDLRQRKSAPTTSAKSAEPAFSLFDVGSRISRALARPPGRQS